AASMASSAAFASAVAEADENATRAASSAGHGWEASARLATTEAATNARIGQTADRAPARRRRLDFPLSGKRGAHFKQPATRRPVSRLTSAPKARRHGPFPWAGLTPFRETSYSRGDAGNSLDPSPFDIEHSYSLRRPRRDVESKSVHPTEVGCGSSFEAP